MYGLLPLHIFISEVEHVIKIKKSAYWQNEETALLLEIAIFVQSTVNNNQNKAVVSVLVTLL